MGLDGCNPRFAETHRSLQHPGSAGALAGPCLQNHDGHQAGTAAPLSTNVLSTRASQSPAGEGAGAPRKVPRTLDDSSLFDAFTMGFDGCIPKFTETHRSLQHPGSALTFRRLMSPKPPWSPGPNHCPTFHECPIDPNPAVPCRRGRRRSQESPAHLRRQCVVRCVHYGRGRVQPKVRRNSQVSLQHPGSALALRRPMSPKPRWSPGGNHRPTFHECPIDPYPAVPCRRGRRRSQESPAHLGRQFVVRCVHYGL